MSTPVLEVGASVSAQKAQRIFSDDEPMHPTNRRIAQHPKNHITLLFAGLIVTMLMSSLNGTILSTALPTIVGELNGVQQMSWVITGYILASTVMMPIYGRISDMLGRKPVLLTAIAIFLAGSVIGGLAQNIWWLVAARVVQGLGGGGLIILSQAAIADVVPARERGKYVGIMGGVFAISSVAGPLIGGWLTESVGWRWAFWLNLPLGALSILATIFLLHLPKPARVTGQLRSQLDYTGMTLLAVVTTLVVLICTWGGHSYAWGSAQIIGMSVVALVLAALFCGVELRASSPVIPMNLFKDRNFTLTTIAALSTGVAMFGVIAYLPTYIQMVTGLDATKAGLMMAPMMCAMLVANVVSGQIVTRTGRYKVFPILGAAIMAVGLWLLSRLQVESPVWWLCIAAAVFGVGIGLINQILVLIVQNSFPNAIVGTATAANNYFRQVGASVGSAIVGTLFVSRLHDLLVQKVPQLAHAHSGGSVGGGENALTPAAVAHLPQALRDPIMHSYSEALLPIFLFLVPLAALVLLLMLFIEEKPLATSIDSGETRTEVALELLAEDAPQTEQVDAELISGMRRV